MSDRTTGKEKSSGSPGIVLVLTLVALSVRLILLSHVRVIETDSAYYAYLAGEFSRGNFLEGLNPAWPPFYPFLVGMVSRLNGDIALSAQIVSIVSGALLVPVVFRLARSVFGFYVALVASTIAAFHPRLILYSELFLTESLYVLLFAVAMMLLVEYLGGQSHESRGRKGATILRALFSGVFFFLLFATRPEGAVLFAAVSGFILLSYLLSPMRIAHALSAFALIVTGFLLLFVPFSLLFHSATGRFLPGEKGRYNFYVTYKRDYIQRNIDVETGWMNRIPPVRERRYDSVGQEVKNGPSCTMECFSSNYRIMDYLAGAWPGVSKHIFSTFARNLLDKVPSCEYYPLFLLTLLGLVLPRKRHRVELIFGFAIVLFILALSVFFPLRRFFVVLLPLLIIWAAVGFVRIMRLVPLYSLSPSGGLAISNRFLKMASIARLVSSVMVFVVLLFSYIYARELVAKRNYPDEYRAAGEWLKANCSFRPTIASRKPEVSFYAGGYFIPLPHIDPQELAKWMKSEGVTHIFLDDRIMPRSHAELSGLLSGEVEPDGLRIVYKRKIKGHSAIIFALSED